MLGHKEFSKRIKSKYPEYRDIDDLELAQKIVGKYPENKDKVQFEIVEQVNIEEESP